MPIEHQKTGAADLEHLASARARCANALETIAFAILLLCVVSRVFLNEVPFRSSEVMAIGHVGATDTMKQLPADHTELARVTFAGLLLAAAMLWAAAGAVRGRLTIQRPALAALVTAFAVLALVSALGASNKRWALDSYIEQVSLLLIPLLASQLLCSPQRLRAAVLMLAAVAIAMGASGLWERFVEIPQRIADFSADPQKYLSQMGIEPGSPDAIAYQARVLSNTPVGFGALSNVFASLLLATMLVLAGLALDQLRYARGGYAAFKAAAAKGELHVPTLRGVLLAMLCLPPAAVLVLTRSRGGVIAGVLAIALAAAVFRWRSALARRWRKAMLAIPALLLILIVAVTAYGLTHNSLPTRTMTFRWFYWKASGQMVAQHPAWGVGPANFATAYLPLRDAAAEEAVKSPHNVLAQALAEYGVPAGLCFLAVLGLGLYLICRPRSQAEMEPQGLSSPQAAKARYWHWAAVCAVGVAAARILFSSSSRWAMPTEALGPALLFCGSAGAALLLLRDFLAGRTGDTGLRIALGCAVGAFLLHELINLCLFMPSTAGVFYLALGAALALTPAGKQCNLQVPARGGLLALLAAAVAITALTLWRPVYDRTAYSEQMVQAMYRQDDAQVAQWAAAAARADSLDALAAADAARAYRKLYQTRQSPNDLQQALDWSLQAARREDSNPSWHRMAGMFYVELAAHGRGSPNDAMEQLRRAVTLDPSNTRMRLDFARLLAQYGLKKLAAHELSEARRIDAALFPDSAYRLKAKDLEEMSALEAQLK